MMKRVLLVTNSALTRQVLGGTLEDRDWEVVMAKDTWEAVGACGGRAIDLVLIDLDWPEDTGWSGWELIKGAHAAEPWLPILLITGRGELAETARAAGVWGLAEKPLDVAALVEVAEGLAEERTNPVRRSSLFRPSRFERIPPEGEALRTAILSTFQRSFRASEHYEHWGLNE